MRLCCSRWTAMFCIPVCGCSPSASRGQPRGPACHHPRALPGASRSLPEVSRRGTQQEACAAGCKPEQSCMLMPLLAGYVLADVPLQTCVLSPTPQ